MPLTRHQRLHYSILDACVLTVEAGVDAGPTAGGQQLGQAQEP